MVEKCVIDIRGLDWIRELVQKMHELGYSGLDLAIGFGYIEIFKQGISAKNARVGRVMFFVVDWKILRVDGKEKKVMLKCGCGIHQKI